VSGFTRISMPAMQVNSAELEEDILSDHVYYYSREEKNEG